MLVRHLAASLVNDVKERFRFHQDVEKAINGNIAFLGPSNVITTQMLNSFQTVPQHCDNIDGVLVIVPDTGLAGVEFSVIHNLNRVPQLLDIKRKNLACNIFDSGTTWTSTKIFLKCDVAHVKTTLHIH